MHLDWKATGKTLTKWVEKTQDLKTTCIDVSEY